LPALGVLVLAGSFPFAQEPTTAQQQKTPENPEVVDVRPLMRGRETGFEVVVQGLRDSEGRWRDDPEKWILFFDDVPDPKLKPIIQLGASGDDSSGPVTFCFAFSYKTTEDQAYRAWRDLLSRGGFFRTSSITLGRPDGSLRARELRVAFKQLMFVGLRFWIVAVIFVIIVFRVLWLMLLGRLVKEGDKFSLGRTQMAFWFLVVLGAYLFIGVATGMWMGTISEQALALMGISATAGGAAVVIQEKKEASAAANRETEEQLHDHKSALRAAMADNAKTDNVPLLAVQLSDTILHLAKVSAKVVRAKATARLPSAGASFSGSKTTEKWRGFTAEWKALKANLATFKAKCRDFLSPAKWWGFFRDIVSNTDGVTLSRVQVLVWTVVLGFVFGMHVVVDLAMPELDIKMLALMGISSGAYLGFKFPERS